MRLKALVFRRTWNIKCHFYLVWSAAEELIGSCEMKQIWYILHRIFRSFSVLYLETCQELLGSNQPCHFLLSFCQTALSSLKVAFSHTQQALGTVSRLRLWPRRSKDQSRLFSCSTVGVQPARACMWTVHFSITLLPCFLMEQSSPLGVYYRRNEPCTLASKLQRKCVLRLFNHITVMYLESI